MASAPRTVARSRATFVRYPLPRSEHQLSRLWAQSTIEPDQLHLSPWIQKQWYTSVEIIQGGSLSLAGRYINCCTTSDMLDFYVGGKSQGRGVSGVVERIGRSLAVH